MSKDNGLGDFFQTMGKALEDGQRIAKEAEEEFKAQCAAKNKKRKQQSGKTPKK